MSVHLPEVIGRQCLRPLDEMERAALVLLGDEQCMPNPNTALIGFLCDAARMCRQQEDGNKTKTSNGAYRKCLKCGAEPVEFHYHRSRDDCNTLWRSEVEFQGEHLHFHCSCGYQWSEPPLDKQAIDGLKRGWKAGSPSDPGT
jgi:hypothetical protein